MHLERLLLILEIVGQRQAATVADICAHSDLPKPSVYRLVQDLLNAGLLAPVDKGRYSLGARLRRIAQPSQTDAALIALAGPRLQNAAQTHGASFFLSRLRGRAVEIIHVETPRNGVSYLHPGLGKRPLHACSCSKAIAAFHPDLFPVPGPDGGLRAYTDHTVTRAEDLAEEFAAIRARGYAECVEEIEHGMCSVAAPVRRADAQVLLSIGATGSVRVFSPEFRRRIGATMIDMARALSDDLAQLPVSPPEADQPKSSLA